MLKAWKVYRSSKQISFGEALHRAWLSAKSKRKSMQRIETAKQAAGITEEINTFAKWKELGYKVVHGSKALFDVLLSGEAEEMGQHIKPVSFGKSQVETI